MIEGVVAANHLVGPAAARAREELWRVVSPEPIVGRELVESVDRVDRVELEHERARVA